MHTPCIPIITDTGILSENIENVIIDESISTNNNIFLEHSNVNDDPITILRHLRTKNAGKLIIDHININSLRNPSSEIRWIYLYFLKRK